MKYYLDNEGNLYCLNEEKKFYTYEEQETEFVDEDGTIHHEIVKVAKEYNAELTEEEYNIELEKRKVIDNARAEKLKEIADTRKLLAKYKEDVEQVELFGMTRDDYEEKKAKCVELIEKLRQLEKGE